MGPQGPHLAPACPGALSPGESTGAEASPFSHGVPEEKTYCRVLLPARGLLVSAGSCFCKCIRATGPGPYAGRSLVDAFGVCLSFSLGVGSPAQGIDN